MLYRKIHPTWLLTAAALALALGVAWSAVWPPTMWYSLAWLLVGMLAIIVTVIWPRRYMIVVAIVAGLVIGLWRGAQEQMALTLYDPARGRAVTMSGTVLDDPDSTKRGETVLRLGELASRGAQLPGHLWLVSTDKLMVQRGDRITFEGKLAEGFGSFAASVRDPHIVSIAAHSRNDPALALRDTFATSVREVVGEPQASLGIGYVVGQRRALPEDLDRALTIAGLTHIVVASGYNLSILVRLARRLFAKISRYAAGAMTVTMIMGFIAVTGMSPSMVRAGLISGLSLWAWYVGRKFHPMTLLAIALAVTVLWQPSYAWGDLGWQLSFLAFAGVMVLAPLVHAYFWGNDTPSHWRQLIIETMAAQVATAPVIIMAFGKLSVIAPLSNLLILPFVPFAMLLTFAAGILHGLMPAFTIVGAPAQWLLGYMTYIAETSARVSWAQVDIRLEWWGVVLYYALLIAVCAYIKWRTGYNLRDSNIVE